MAHYPPETAERIRRDVAEGKELAAHLAALAEADELAVHLPALRAELARRNLDHAREKARLPSPQPIDDTAACSTCGCRGSCPSKARGEVDPDAVPCAGCGCRWCGSAVAGFNPPGTYRCLGCDDCVPHGTPHACGGEEAIRLREEAPLVELVKAVPDGLDPIGWRAAVLGLRERHVLNGRFSATEATVTDAKNLTVMLQRFAADIARGVPVEEAQTATNSRCLAMTTAYAWAIAPRGPRPEPHRRRAPGLPLDAD